MEPYRFSYFGGFDYPKPSYHFDSTVPNENKLSPYQRRNRLKWGTKSKRRGFRK